MNVCLVSQEYPPETGWGGIGTYTQNLAHALAREGLCVWVVCLGTSLRLSKYKDGNVTVIRLPCAPDFFLRTTLGTLIYSMQVAAAVCSLARCSRKEFVVEAPEWFAEAFWLSLSQREFPVVVKLHSPHFLVSRLNLAPHRRGIERLEYKAAKKADVVHAPSKAIANLVGVEWDIPAAQIEILPYPVDVERYHPPKVYESDFPLILYIGRMERRKGVLTIAHAIPQVISRNPQARFVFIGRDMPDSDGKSMRAKLRCLVERSGVSANVEFWDEMKREDLVPWYQRATITLIPSLWENYPNVCLEAMACGSAVIASDVGGLPEMIEEGVSGVLVPPAAPVHLADALNELLARPSLCEELGQRAAGKMRRENSFPKTAAGVTDSYLRALNKSKGRQ